MSAFFVDDECLTKCVTAILLWTDQFGDTLTHNGTGRSTPILHAERLSGSKIGRALREMNIAALHARYDDRLDPEEIDPSYEFTDYTAPHVPAIAFYKALHCLRYQCSEGDVPETNPLYAELDRVIELMEQHEKVSKKHPGWDAAPWGD